jgi:ribonuclease P protein component
MASAAPWLSRMGNTNEGFPKSDRILKRENFRRTYAGGRKYQAKYFTAFVISNQQESSRLGITVTRKTGKSVERNRSRRLVREVFRKNKWRVPAGVDIVINVKTALSSAGYDDLEGDFIEFLKRAK